MQDDAANEGISRCVLETPEPTEIFWLDGRRSLDFDADDLAPAFQHEIDFDLVLVAVVADVYLAGGHRSLLHEFRKNKALKQRPKSLPVGVNLIGADTSQRCQKTGIEKVHLRRFDETLQIVGMSGAHAPEHEHLFK